MRLDIDVVRGVISCEPEGDGEMQTYLVVVCMIRFCNITAQLNL